MKPQNGKNNRPKKSKRLYRLASKKGLRAVPRDIQKAHGAQNGTPKKHQNKKDARPEQANKTKRRGQKKKKKNNTTCGGVCGVLLALSSISSRKKRKKRNNTNDVVNPNPKTERTRQKTRPDIKRIFLRHFRGEIARKYAKTIGKSIPKTQGPKKRAKTKVRSRKFIAQTEP